MQGSILQPHNNIEKNKFPAQTTARSYVIHHVERAGGRCAAIELLKIEAYRKFQETALTELVLQMKIWANILMLREDC